ncbi:MAG: hypothetical protein KDA96_21860, partial [Planctomycetaceae bacterium]|nr:hypothetical protein [Planctomycetaceae bacterium]
MDRITGSECLVLLDHGTTLATAIREALPDVNWTFYTSEDFFFQTLRRFHTDAVLSRMDVDATAAGPGESVRCRLVCDVQPPEGPFDSVIVPTSSTGN